jgi:hypothetical protein
VFAFLPHDQRWQKLYSEDFSVDEMKTIIGALDQAVWQAGYVAEKHWGEPMEDGESQIAFSALGQAAPLAEKEKLDPDFSKRKAIEGILAPLSDWSPTICDDTVPRSGISGSNGDTSGGDGETTQLKIRIS